jgi:hypothetical protein
MIIHIMKQKTLNEKIIKSDVGLPTNYCTIFLSKKKLFFKNGFQST